MNASELRNKTVNELQGELLALFKEQFKLRMQKGMEQQSPQTHQFKKIKKTIARIKTILSEKEGS